MSEKRTRISLAQKLDIIEASKKSGFSIEDVMKKYGLKKSTVYRLLAEKEKYTQQEVNTPSSNRVKPVYSSKAPSTANIELEKRLMDWIVHQEQKNLMVGGEQIKERAEMIAKELKITDCTFSNGWFHRFKARHNLKFKTSHGEAKSADSDAE